MPSIRPALPLAILLLSLSACAPARDAAGDAPSADDPEPPAVAAPAEPREPGEAPEPRDAFTGTCDAKAAQSLVGKVATPDVAEQARTAAGAKGVRVLKPGQMVTMEYRAGRLNLDVDGDNVITAVRCG
jgi:hypothetical protein